MKLHRLLVAVAAVGILSALGGQAQAQGFGGAGRGPGIGAGVHGGGLYRGGFYGFRGPASLYGLGRLFVPPHFAIHPPVYYSLPQAHPYGHSPFAHSGDYQAPLPAKRLVVANPFVEEMPLPEPVDAAADTTTSTVRVITNPYYSAGPEASLAAQTE